MSTTDLNSRSRPWVAVTLAAVLVAALAGCQPASPPSQAAAAASAGKINGHPDFNGVWEAVSSAYWNLEDHSASGLSQFWQLGAIAAIPAGQSIVEGGTIPYLPAALAQRDANRAGWPKTDPEAKCYMPGIPRATYMPFPFRIVQGDGDILFVYEFASANRIVHMSNHQEPPVDSWMGWSNGHWDGDTLVIEVTGNNDQTWFDRAGNYHGAAMKVTERYTREGREPPSVRGHDRGPGDVLAAVEDLAAAVPQARAERSAARVQVRGVRRGAALRRPDEEIRVE